VETERDTLLENGQMGGRGRKRARKEADVWADSIAVSGKMSAASSATLMRSQLDETGTCDTADTEDRAPKGEGGGGWLVGTGVGSREEGAACQAGERQSDCS